MEKVKFTDQEAIENLLKYTGDAAHELVEQLLNFFEQSTPGMMAKMKLHLKSGEIEEMGSLAHTMKSSCLNLGAVKMGRTFEEIEDAVYSKSANGMGFFAERIQLLEDIYPETLLQLKEIKKQLLPHRIHESRV